MDKSIEIFQIMKELAENIVLKINNLEVKNDGRYFKLAMLFFFCKAYKTYQAIELLREKGFSEDAKILTRTIFEIFLQAQYMDNNPEQRAKRFWNYIDVAAYRFYEDILNNAILKPNIINLLSDNQFIQKDKINELKQIHNKFKKNYPKFKGWWGKSIFWLAKELDREMPNEKNKAMLYKSVYWMDSTFVHSSPSATSNYLLKNKNKFIANCYPEKSKNIFNLRTSTQFFFNIMKLINKSFNLGLDEDIKRSQNKLEYILPKK